MKNPNSFFNRSNASILILTSFLVFCGKASSQTSGAGQITPRTNSGQPFVSPSSKKKPAIDVSISSYYSGDFGAPRVESTKVGNTTTIRIGGTPELVWTERKKLVGKIIVPASYDTSSILLLVLEKKHSISKQDITENDRLRIGLPKLPVEDYKDVERDLQTLALAMRKPLTYVNNGPIDLDSIVRLDSVEKVWQKMDRTGGIRVLEEKSKKPKPEGIKGCFSSNHFVSHEWVPDVARVASPNEIHSAFSEGKRMISRLQKFFNGAHDRLGKAQADADWKTLAGSVMKLNSLFHQYSSDEQLWVFPFQGATERGTTHYFELSDRDSKMTLCEKMLQGVGR